MDAQRLEPPREAAGISEPGGGGGIALGMEWSPSTGSIAAKTPSRSIEGTASSSIMAPGSASLGNHGEPMRSLVSTCIPAGRRSTVTSGASSLTYATASDAASPKSRLKGLKARGASALRYDSTASTEPSLRASSTRAPRERLVESGIPQVRWLVIPTKNPRPVTPSHVPWPCLSRPPATLGDSESTTGPVARRLVNSSRLAATISGYPGCTPRSAMMVHMPSGGSYTPSLRPR
ncbi:MAG: hypothetical protein IPN17_15775 [Deltaproteobacteria bacterium]|nr:hypothetical protein [Deltaproteobacteria bacterium]